jgi:hypothetical protein
MSYRIEATGGLYPEGYCTVVMTASGAIERLVGVRRLCPDAHVFTDQDAELSMFQLQELAEAELTETV